MADLVLKTIPLSMIRENPVALRSVNRTSEQFIGLVDSVRRNGVLNAIVVREIIDPESKQQLYGLVDGLHRFSAASDAGLTEIPAQVCLFDDAETLEAQVLANVHKVETKPVEYSKQLMRILAQNPTRTVTELANRLSKSGSWLGERLGLTKLVSEIQSLVDEGKVNLSNAYALAKLPADEQTNFVDRAITMSPQEFVPTVHARVKEIRDLKRQGRDAAPAGFTPVPHVRKIGELKDELTSKSVAHVLPKELGITSVTEAFHLGVQWSLHMDPASIEVARQKDQQRKRDAEEAKLKREKERTDKQAKEAAEKQARIKEELQKRQTVTV